MNFKVGSRAPKCTRCRNHGVLSDLRGHKHKCSFKDCGCRKCLISSDKQRATADRIALFRQQVREVTETDKMVKFDMVENNNRREYDFSPNVSNGVTFGHFTPSTQSKIHAKPPELSQLDVRTKNIDVLKYVFPFYDTTTLDKISKGCKDNVLQTVLCISASVLENQKRMSPFDSYDYRLKPHVPLSPVTEGNRCCDSPYCPVNSYIALRKRDSVETPSFMSAGHSAKSLKRFSFSDEDIRAEKVKRKQSSPSSSITEKLNKSPYCTSCKRLGALGDKFCPQCGVLY